MHMDKKVLDKRQIEERIEKRCARDKGIGDRVVQDHTAINRKILRDRWQHV